MHAVREGVLRRLLKTHVEGQPDRAPRDVLRGLSDRTERPPERVDSQFVLPGGAPEVRVEGRLDPGLAYLVARDHSGRMLLQLLLRDFRDVAEELRRHRPVRIVAQERVLETEPPELVLMFLEVADLWLPDGLLDDHRRQRVAFPRSDPLQHVVDRDMQDPFESLQLTKAQVPLVRQIGRPEDDGRAGVVVHQDAAVAVEDHAAGRLDADRAQLVVLRDAQVLVTREDLQRPEP